MEYQPDFIKGQIVVYFNKIKDTEFIKDFGEKLGYTFIEEFPCSDHGYVFETKEGLEDQACKNFEKYSEFVECTQLRDIKLEKRWETLETAIEMLDFLLDNAILPDKQYTEQIDQIINHLKVK